MHWRSRTLPWGPPLPLLVLLLLLWCCSSLACGALQLRVEDAEEGVPVTPFVEVGELLFQEDRPVFEPAAGLAGTLGSLLRGRTRSPHTLLRLQLGQVAAILPLSQIPASSASLSVLVDFSRGSSNQYTVHALHFATSDVTSDEGVTTITKAPQQLKVRAVPFPKAPRPIPKEEQHRKAKDPASEPGFLSKYGMYLAPVAIIFLMKAFM